MHDQGRVQVGLRLSRELLERVDAARGDVSRTRWFERAVEAALREGVAKPGAVQAVTSQVDVGVDRAAAFGRLGAIDAGVRARS